MKEHGKLDCAGCFEIHFRRQVVIRVGIARIESFAFLSYVFDECYTFHRSISTRETNNPSLRGQERVTNYALTYRNVFPIPRTLDGALPRSPPPPPFPPLRPRAHIIIPLRSSAIGKAARVRRVLLRADVTFARQRRRCTRTCVRKHAIALYHRDRFAARWNARHTC